MKAGKVFIVLLISILIISCNKKKETESQKEALQNEIIAVEEDINVSKEEQVDCISVFKETLDSAKKIIKHFLEKDVVLYEMDKNYNPTPIGTVEKKTEISIIAHLDAEHMKDNKDFYLISLNQGNVWDGWIEASSINFKITKNFYQYLNSKNINISPSNKYMTYKSRSGSYYVINSDASKIIDCGNYSIDWSNSLEQAFTDLNTEEEINASLMLPVYLSISEPFKYEFPYINLEAPTYTYSISDLSAEEKFFYDKYVGCYISKRMLSDLSSYLSEVQVKYIENGIVFWGFFSSFEAIRYNPEEKNFYEYDFFSCSPIDNLFDFELNHIPYYEQKYKKFTDCKIVEDLIAEKKSKMNRPPLTELQEQNVRNFLKEFFTSLCKKDFDEVIDTFFVSKNDRDKIRSSLYGHKWLLEHESPEFRTYINVFFNDDIDKFDKDTIFVELGIDGIYNYVSFALKEINDELKITNYVVRYNQL